MDKFFNSIKNQTNYISALVPIDIPSTLNNAKAKLMRPTVKQSKHSYKEVKNKWPNLLEQLQWPELGLFKAEKSTLSQEENDIIDKFIKIVEAEEESENNNYRTLHSDVAVTEVQRQRRRTDREEIRKKLAMGTDDEVFNDGALKKPSLQSRLRNGKNLQICFMNETASDCESQCSDTESTQDRIDEMEGIINSKEMSKMTESEVQSMDFVTRQAKLQAEARLALSQAKEMARMQMEIEKQSQKKSPITEIIKDSFNKIGFPFPAGKRRMSRQLLTDINVAQLQVIVNDLHTQIEILNEDLVQMLLSRDDLHMEQDSMLVDIEDLTKHLGAIQGPNPVLNSNGMSKSLPPSSNHLKFSHKTVIPMRNLKLRATVKK